MGRRAVLDVCGKLSPPTGIRSPDRPARRESLYRLRRSGPHVTTMFVNIYLYNTLAYVYLNSIFYIVSCLSFVSGLQVTLADTSNKSQK